MFPSDRQVAYVLLTSPPLTALKLKEWVKFVRLACLMCAASVYPEPGSNSLVCCLYVVDFSTLHIFFKSFLTHFTLSVFLIGFLQFLYRVRILQSILLKGIYCLFFNVLFLFFVCSVLRNVTYYTTHIFNCQHFF